MVTKKNGKVEMPKTSPAQWLIQSQIEQGVCSLRMNGDKDTQPGNSLKSLVAKYGKVRAQSECLMARLDQWVVFRWQRRFARTYHDINGIAGGTLVAHHHPGLCLCRGECAVTSTRFVTSGVSSPAVNLHAQLALKLISARFLLEQVYSVIRGMDVASLLESLPAVISSRVISFLQCLLFVGYLLNWPALEGRNVGRGPDGKIHGGDGAGRESDREKGRL